METIDTSGRGTSGRCGKLGSTPHLAPQNDQLMSEHHIFRLKSAVYTENLIRVDDVMESHKLVE